MLREVRLAAVGCLAVCASAMGAQPAISAVLLPESYEAPSPNNGSFAYQDDTYSGTNSGGLLSGGTGDLTDGVIASAHWFTTPGPWVGWLNIDPTITFHFASGTVIDTIDFYFDDANGAGGVDLPSGVTLSAGGSGLMATPTITSDGVVARYSFTLNGVAATDLSALVSRGSSWTMLTEVTFNGSAGDVPEPAAWAMFIAGFGMVGAALRQRRRIGVRFA